MERSSQYNASGCHSLPDAYWLMFSDEDALRRQIDDLLHWIDYDNDELAFIIKALKLKGTNSFILDNKRVFVTCTSKGYNLFYVKKLRSNLGLECDKYKTARDKEKRCAIE